MLSSGNRYVHGDAPFGYAFIHVPRQTVKGVLAAADDDGAPCCLRLRSSTIETAISMMPSKGQKQGKFRF